MTPKEYWKPVLSDSPNFTLFVDELTQTAEEIKTLPYGILAVVTGLMTDLASGKTEILEDDRPIAMRACCFIAGILIAKEDKTLEFSEGDFDKLWRIFNDLAVNISAIDLVYAGHMKAKFIDGEWCYGLTEKGINMSINIIRKLSKSL